MHIRKAPMKAPKNRIWRTIAVILMVPALSVAFYSGTIWNRYLKELPRSPNPTTGRIYPRNIHGIIVYQTHAEQLRLDLMDEISTGVFFAGLIIGAIEEKHWRKTGGKNLPPMPKNWRGPGPGAGRTSKIHHK